MPDRGVEDWHAHCLAGLEQRSATHYSSGHGTRLHLQPSEHSGGSDSTDYTFLINVSQLRLL